MHAYLVLRHVKLFPGVSQRVLAKHLGLEAPTLTHHLDRLVSQVLVERIQGSGDRRVFSVALTAAGSAHLREADKVGARLDTDLRSLLSAQELATLEGALERIVDHYENLAHGEKATKTESPGAGR
ncbi:MAG: MarR family winged helix-turn-helix transcriptional regulator [Acidimicrobiales bacterium]